MSYYCHLYKLSTISYPKSQSRSRSESVNCKNSMRAKAFSKCLHENIKILRKSYIFIFYSEINWIISKICKSTLNNSQPNWGKLINSHSKSGSIGGDEELCDPDLTYCRVYVQHNTIYPSKFHMQSQNP